MENAKKLDSGFQIKNLILIESSSFRVNSVTFDESVESDFNINVEVAVNDKVITVAEEAVFIQKYQEVEQVKIKVKMIGVFECIGNSPLTNYEEFGRVNGAAIIFPYIREHITNISLKSGIGAIILPPVNFTKIEKI